MAAVIAKQMVELPGLDARCPVSRQIDQLPVFSQFVEDDRLPLGVFYVNPKDSFEENVGTYDDDARPLYERESDQDKLTALIDRFKMTV